MYGFSGRPRGCSTVVVLITESIWWVSSSLWTYIPPCVWLLLSFSMACQIIVIIKGMGELFVTSSSSCNINNKYHISRAAAFIRGEFGNWTMEWSRTMVEEILSRQVAFFSPVWSDGYAILLELEEGWFPGPSSIKKTLLLHAIAGFILRWKSLISFWNFRRRYLSRLK